MLGIIFDKNTEAGFQNQDYPVFNVCVDGKSFGELRKEAQVLVEKNDKPTVIIKSASPMQPLNLFILALCIEAHKNESPKTAVFKINNLQEAIKEHKKYAPLIIAITYIHRLLTLDDKSMYKDIEGLGYLGLGIDSDVSGRISIKLQGTGTMHRLEARSKTENLILTGLIKALSLIEKKPNFEIIIDKRYSSETTPVNMDNVINGIMKNASEFIKLDL